MSIEKLEGVKRDGKQAYRIRMEFGTDEAGKRIRKSEVIYGDKEAKSRHAELVQEKDTGRAVTSKKQTMGAYLAEWLETAARPRLKQRTFQDYSEIVARYVKPRLGKVQVNQITSLLLQKLYSEHLKSGLQASTIRKTHAVIHSALKQAVRWRFLPYNPAQDVELPRMERKEAPALGVEVADRFIEAALTMPRGIVYLVAMATGMRPAEYLGLKWPDVNLETGEIRVQRVLNWLRGQGGGWVFEEPKTAKGRRTVTIPPTVCTWLRAHRDAQRAAREHAGDLWQDHGLVFTSETGGPLDPDNLNTRYFKPILAAAGLPETLRPYDLRHACATILLEAGTPAKVVGERLGHSSITLTMDTYSHVTPTMQRGAADKLEESVFGKHAPAPPREAIPSHDDGPSHDGPMNE